MTGLAPRRWTLIAALSAVMLALVCAGPAAAEVTLEPTAGLAFGTVQTGLAVDSEVGVVNDGPLPVTIGAASLTGNPSFSIALDDCEGLTLDPDEFCVVVIRFAPTLAGDQAAQLSVPSDDPGSPDVLAISGAGVAPIPPPRPPVVIRPTRPTPTPGVLGADPLALDFGSVVVKKGRPVASVTVTRSGAVGRISTHFEGPDATAFTVNGGSCGLLGTTAPTCFSAVLFAPKREGPHEATLVIAAANANTVTVALRGVGVPAPVEKLPDGQVKRLLKGALTVPVGKWGDKRRRSILKAKGFSLNGPAIPGKGTLKLQVRTTGKRQHLVASGRLSYPRTKKPQTVVAALTRSGKALLRDQGKARLQAVLTFVAADGTRLTASRAFTLAD